MRRHLDCFADGVAGPVSASAPLSRSFRSVCSPLAECAAPASANSPPFRSRNLCSDSPPMARGVQRPSGRHRFVSTPPSPRAIAVTTPLPRSLRPRWPDRSCLSPVPASPLSGFCSHTPRTTGAILVKAATACDGPRPAAMNPVDSTPGHAGSGSDHSGRSSQLIDVLAFSDYRRLFWSLPIS